MNNRFDPKQTFVLTILTHFVSACLDVTWDTYEDFLQHLIHIHKICRKFYEAYEVAQPQPTSSAEPACSSDEEIEELEIKVGKSQKGIFNLEYSV